MTREELFHRGLDHISSWCRANRVDVPLVTRQYGEPDFGTCAYYRDGEIYIWVESCAHVGMGGRAWSYPGYVVDRTPYGVLAHELGHHVDGAHGARVGPTMIAPKLFQETKEKAITSYTPNVNEWFAEIFRLFVTNPDLLRLLRPLMYSVLSERWPTRIETRVWEDVVTEERQRNAARNKIRAAS